VRSRLAAQFAFDLSADVLDALGRIADRRRIPRVFLVAGSGGRVGEVLGDSLPAASAVCLAFSVSFLMRNASISACIRWEAAVSRC
jgi:hypothetical protein